MLKVWMLTNGVAGDPVYVNVNYITKIEPRYSGGGAYGSYVTLVDGSHYIHHESPDVLIAATW